MVHVFALPSPCISFTQHSIGQLASSLPKLSCPGKCNRGCLHVDPALEPLAVLVDPAARRLAEPASAPQPSHWKPPKGGLPRGFGTGVVVLRLRRSASSCSIRSRSCRLRGVSSAIRMERIKCLDLILLAV